MTVTLADRAAAYLEAARQVHDIEVSGLPEADRLEDIKIVLTALSRRPELFPPEAFPRAPDTAGGLFRLAQFPDGRGALYVSLGYTGRGGISPHTHASWAVVVGLSGGVEQNWIYDRVDDGSVEGEAELKLREQVAIGPGDAVVIPTGVFHTIDVVSETPVLHIHAYGHAVDTTGFELPVFETPESRTYSLRATGAFQPPLAAADPADVRREAAHGLVAVVFLEPARPDITGPLVFRSTADKAVAALAGVDRGLPVILAGAASEAAAAAARLYADRRPVVFRLEDSAVAKAA
jgi:predicted metal-dependent enzyme (double-stranded beta helix superfamily)